MTLREVLVRKGIRFFDAPNNHISVCCLFCTEMGDSPDERFRLSINLTNGKCICFNCGFKSQSGFRRILYKLRVSGEIMGETTEPTEQERVVALPDDFQCLSMIASDLDEMALKYLRGRGITPRQIRQKNIGISLIGRLAYRIVFPVTYQEELIGVVARDFTKHQEPKYLNSLGRKGLYNVGGYARRVILSEGVFKVLRIERLGTGFASCGLLGRDITDYQIEQLKEMGCKEIVLWPDPDKPGRQGAAKIGARLSEEGFHVGIVWPLKQAADEEPLDSMEDTWQNLQGWGWLLEKKLLRHAS